MRSIDAPMANVPTKGDLLDRLPSWPILLIVCAFILSASLGVLFVLDRVLADKEAKRITILAMELQPLSSRDFVRQLDRAGRKENIVTLCQAWEVAHRGEPAKEHLRVWMAAKDQWLTNSTPYEKRSRDLTYITEKISASLDASLPDPVPDESAAGRQAP